MHSIWNTWFLITIAIPVFYAADCLLDVFFVNKNIYRNPVHASILSGLFAGVLIVLIIPNHEQIILPNFEISILALSCGCFYFLHIYFYFNALFKLNDASNIEMYLGFSVVLVPMLALLILNEKLQQNHFTGIGLATIGILILTYSSSGRSQFSDSLTSMSGAIIMLSVTYVVQDYVFNFVNFYTGLLFFMLGKAVSAMILWLGSSCQFIIADIKKYWPYFILIQLSGLIAIILTLRAIEIAPYLTLVVLFEAAAPIFIILFSLFLLFIFSISKANHHASVSALKEQLVNVPMKMIAFVFLTSGIVFATMDNMSELTLTSFGQLLEPGTINR